MKKEEKKFICGAITKAGTPCKIKVANEGDRCHIHAGKDEATVKTEVVDEVVEDDEDYFADDEDEMEDDE